MPVEAWKYVSQEDIDDWRKKVKKNIQTRKNWRWEYNTAHHTGLERAETNPDGSARITAPKSATSIRQHRDTAEVAAESMVRWAKENKNQFMHRVRILKRQGNFVHLTDEQAAERLWEICRKLAEESAQRVYARDGYDSRFWKDPIG